MKVTTRSTSSEYMLEDIWRECGQLNFTSTCFLRKVNPSRLCKESGFVNVNTNQTNKNIQLEDQTISCLMHEK